MDFALEEFEGKFLLRPLTEAARLWTAENLPNAEYVGDAVVVEPRDIHDIVEQIRLDGLEVE